MKILIPMDGSEASAAILRPLLPLIRSRDIDSTLLQVVDVAEAGPSTERLERLRETLEAQGVTARVLVIPGNPAVEIVEAAVRGRFDLIAMGTRCPSKLLSGVTEEVVRTSRVPVLLARADCPIGSWESIIVALNGTPGGEAILADVIGLARSLHPVVHLVRVCRPGRIDDDYTETPGDFPATETISYLTRIAGQLQEEGLRTSVDPIQGEPAPEISRAAKALHAGLICLSTEDRATTEVIRTAPCAVYVRPSRKGA